MSHFYPCHVSFLSIACQGFSGRIISSAELPHQRNFCFGRAKESNSESAITGENRMNENGKLKFTEKLSFGLGELPGTIGTILGAFLTMFYTDSIGMAAAAVGTMFFISKIFDGITDLIAGNIIDHTKTRWGKARPWLLWMAVPSGLATALIFWIPKDGSDMVKMIYAFVTYNLLTSVVFTLVGVAKAALMCLMTQNGFERGKLAMCSLIFGLGGAILGCSVTFPFVAKMGGDVTAWRIVFAIYGLITTVCLLLSFALSYEHVKAIEDIGADAQKKSGMTFWEGVRNFSKNKYFIFALFMTVVVNFAVQINSGSQTFFYTYAMKDPMLVTSLNLVSLVPVFVGILFLAEPCLKFFGKKNSVYVGACGQIVGYLLRGIAALTMNVPLLMAGTVIGGLATGPLSVPINTLSADAVDYGEYLTNKRIEGIGSSVVSFSQKVSTGLAAGCVGWILGLTGYVANADQTAAVKTGIISMFAWVPIVLLIVVMVCFRLFYHYDKEEAGVMAELNRRRQEKIQNNGEKHAE